MADGFIVRKGGVTTAQALAPTITEVSTTTDEIVFTITNNDASTAVILYEVDDATPDENSVELAAAATSSNITVTGLTGGTEYDVYATANVTGKIKSNVAELAIETDPLPVYTAATGGTTLEYDDGGTRYKSHTFTSNGTFEVTTVGDAIDDRNKVDYLIIAGGASGGRRVAGGGGAGGYRTTNGTSGADSSAESKVTVTATSYSVTIGAGGTAVTSTGVGNDGSNSLVAFSQNIISDGGGGGGLGFDNSLKDGRPGGSGGGGGSPSTSGNGNGGTATANQGRNGGLGGHTPGANAAAGGGGGASTVGGNRNVFVGGNGGNGLANLLRTGSNETRAGGGGGAGSGSGSGGSGGSGGGGTGGITNTAGGNGTANTGSGGGGGDETNSGSGGAGIVVIRYEIAPSV